MAARNFANDPGLEAAYCEAVLRSDVSETRRLRNNAKTNSGFYNHMPATDVREKVPKPFWQSAFKFTLERHPYEKVVSLAYWRMAVQRNPASFETVVEAIVQDGGHDDFDLYAENGVVLVDRIFRQEALSEAVEDICRTIGVTGDIALARAKGSHRKDRRPARDILTDDQKRAIRKRSAFSFDVLGYEP
jgi:hypothetical protein